MRRGGLLREHREAGATSRICPGSASRPLSLRSPRELKSGDELAADELDDDGR